MKALSIALGMAGWLILSVPLPAESACKASIPAVVEVSGTEFSLADLLPAGVCPALRSAAARQRLGSVPLAGSPRVIEGAEIRSRIERLAQQRGDSVAVSAPPRVVVRSSGRRASCGDIGGQLLASRSASGSGSDLPLQIDCGAGGRIPQNVELELIRTAWNGALGSWEVSARCTRPSDCVPFLVRVPASASRQDESGIGQLIGTSPNAGPAALHAPVETPLVRPGERVTLIWDQDGIRLVVPAVALDGGSPGQGVRARIAQGGRVVRAIVTSAGMLRVSA
jgi:hypothetical protein